MIFAYTALHFMTSVVINKGTVFYLSARIMTSVVINKGTLFYLSARITPSLSPCWMKAGSVAFVAV